MIVNIFYVKTNLSKLRNMVYHREKAVIAKKNLPIADLEIYKDVEKRKLGLLKGKLYVIYTIDDIMQEDEVINEMFYGESL